MSLRFLDFEQPIIDLEEKIHSLTQFNQKDEKIKIDFDKEIQHLKKKHIKLTQKIFSNLSSWQIAQLSRHPYRPYTLDYIKHIFNDFDELSGDRLYGNDKAIIGGIARLDNRPIMVIGHQKGRKTQEKIQRNFGMPAPEGYRKAHRLMKLAERFNIPLITFIDTPGAYPGIGAEERGQAEAIAKNLCTMSTLKTPIICTIIGEGGSGGALAISIGDKINMLEYSIYSVISPEGCASILWKNIKKAPIAAEEMRIIAPQLKKLKLIDNIISEPIGGAHKNIAEIAFSIKTQLLTDLSELDSLTMQQLINRRYNRLMNYGYC